MLVRVFLWVVAISAGVSGLLVASLPRAPGPPLAPAPPSLQDLIAGSSELSANDLDAHCAIDSIALERTVCFGECPIYTVTFFRSGKAEYVGEAYVDRVGRYEGKLAERSFARLCQLVEHASFGNMKAEYLGAWTDAPSAQVTVTERGQTRKVLDYDEVGPPELWALEQALDNLASRVKWRSAVDAGRPPVTN